MTTVTRRGFIQTAGTVAGLLLAGRDLFGGNLLPTAPASPYVFPESNSVLWRGLFGEAYQKSLRRLTEAPLDTADFILADVNFNQERRFTNYSGDISGRYIEIASLSSTQEAPFPALLPEVIDRVVACQKEDGHFGAEVDWTKPVDIAAATDQSLEMPILWGNGRLLLGLVAAYERFGNEKALTAAKKLGDFYVRIVLPRFCDPNRKAEYAPEAAGYAAAYVTCVFEGMEGLVRLYQTVGDPVYLDTAVKMADFHEAFDKLPVGHSHGSISAHEALLLLYETTGQERFLRRVEKRWEEAVTGGYVNPCGGVAEKFEVAYELDEGCSEADWLRLNLMLWRVTSRTVYLDFAERLLYNGYLANQWPSGGFGHRYFGIDDKGPFAWRKRAAESFWCCSFHGPLGYYDLKRLLAVGDRNVAKLFYLFPLDFRATVSAGGTEWTVDSRILEASPDAPVRTSVTLTSSGGGTVTPVLRIPVWADEIIVQCGEKVVSGKSADGYWTACDPVPSGTTLEMTYRGTVRLENRRWVRQALPAEFPARIPEAVILYGPDVYVSKLSDGQKIEDVPLLFQNGVLSLPDSLTCFQKMNDEERSECHGFVFHISIEP